MEIITLYRIDFDNLENRNAEYKTKLGVFGEKDNFPAKSHLSKFVEELGPSYLYTGWDGKIYPQYITEIDILK